MIGKGSSNDGWASISRSSARVWQTLASIHACKSSTSASSIDGSWRGALALCSECTSRTSAREFAGAPDLTFAAVSLTSCVDRVGLSDRLHDHSSPVARVHQGRNCDPRLELYAWIRIISRIEQEAGSEDPISIHKLTYGGKCPL